jgi:Tfp pilus assembly protein PilF
MTPTTTLRPSANLAGHDARGNALTGATPQAIAYFEQALVAHLSWRGGAEELLAQALDEAPGFVMVHAMQAWLLACSRDINRVRQARVPLQRALGAGPQRHGERLHLGALAALLDDDYPRAKQLLGQLLQRSPRDVLALQAAHALDYLTGDLDQLVERAARVLPAWNSALPGCHAVLAMHAFGLVEGGDGEAAEREARAALAQNPLDVRAHHVMAHVFETTGRAAEGVRWMERHADAWATSRMVATHCAWHLALFHLTLGDVEHALAVHDRHIGATQTGDIADLIDASALLWRVQLQGGDVGARWQALANAWAARVDDRFCSFSDVHAMLAFVGAGDERQARRLVDSLVAIRSRPTRYGQTTRQLGLPACRGLVASGQGQYPLAITHLASLPAAAHRLGGSHAQRDVLYLTLAQAVERMRRPTPRKLARPASSRARRL